MTVKLFGNEVDLMNVAKLVAVVVGVFSLTNYQEKQINDYIRLHNMEWIEKRKRDSEIEDILSSVVSQIKN